MSLFQRDLRISIQVGNALSVLGGWYVSWDFYSSSPCTGRRSYALYAKARGLIGHDRALIKSMDGFEGRSDD